MGVALFFFVQSSPLKVMTFLSCRLLTTPIFPRHLSSVLSKFSHKKINLGRVSPLEGVTRGGPAPSDATAFQL